MIQNKFHYAITREIAVNEGVIDLKSQNVTSNWGGVRKLPYAFTEHGVVMLASLLRSEIAAVWADV